MYTKSKENPLFITFKFHTRPNSSFLICSLVLSNLDHCLPHTSLPIVDHLTRLLHGFDIMKIHRRPNDRFNTSLIDPLAQEIQIRADGIEEPVCVRYVPARGAPLVHAVYDVEEDAEEGRQNGFGGYAQGAGVLHLVARWHGGDGDDHAGLGAEQAEVVHGYADRVKDEVYRSLGDD